MPDNHDQELLYTVIKTAKNDSSFIYFTLESNEGIAFYSTLEHTQGDQHRIIECFTPLALKNEFETIIKNLEKKISLEILEQKKIKDSL